MYGMLFFSERNGDIVYIHSYCFNLYIENVICKGKHYETNCGSFIGKEKDNMAI